MFKNTPAFSSFSVDDIQKAKDFYSHTLTLEVSEIMDSFLKLHIAGGNQIFVYSKEDHLPATFTILNFPVDNIEQTMEELIKRNVHFEIYDQPGFKTDEHGICHWDDTKMASFKDPARNILSILEEKTS